MFFARTLSAAAVLLGLATASANATLLVNTAPMTGTGSWGLNASARLAQSFIAASTDLDDIYLWMSKGPVTSNGSIVVTLRSDVANQPSTSILHALGGPIAETALPNTKNIIELYDIGINDLVIGSRYWIEINSDAGGPTATARWYARNGSGTAALMPIAPATTFQFRTTSTNLTNLFMVCASDGAFESQNCDTQSFGQPYLSIDVTPENAPEPATIAILGAGLVGLGMMSRRRRQAAKV